MEKTGSGKRVRYADQQSSSDGPREINSNAVFVNVATNDNLVRSGGNPNDPPAAQPVEPDPNSLPSQAFGRQNSLRRRQNLPTTIHEEGQGERDGGPGVNIRDDVAPSSRTATLEIPKLSHLNDKIASKRTKRTTRPSTGLQTIQHIYFPKISNVFKSVLYFSPWRPFFKRIHSRFGTGVLAYFIFLRWLIYLNFFLFLLWSSFVIIPQAIWHSTPQGANASIAARMSRLTCIDRNVTRGIARCPQGHEVLNISTSCSSAFTSRECSSTDPVVEGDGVLTASSNTSCVNGTIYAEMWWLCPSVEPVISPGTRILNFISGSGFIYNTSELFIGFYTNEIVNGVYDLPLAFLLTAGALYVISVLAIVIRLGFIYHESYITLGKGEGSDIFNKIFAGWDFNIANYKSSQHHRKTLSRELMELYYEIKSSNEKRSPSRWVLLIFIRTLTNLFVLVCLIGAAVAIYYAVFVELQILTNTSLLSAFVIACLNVILTFVFSLLPRLEQYRKKSTAILITIVRLLLVRLSSLITLIVVVLEQIRCTQPTPEEKGTKCSVDFDLSQAIDISSRTTICPECWETIIGQKFYEQALFTFVIMLGGTVLVDTGKNIFSRIKWPCFKEPINFREFEIPRDVLDLVYLQAIVWLGFFFCPVIPGIALITFFLLFWIKMASTFINLEPSKEAYKAARKDFTFQFILLVTLLACMLPVGFAIARIVPSQNPGCGPFRGEPFIYSVIESRTSVLSCAEQAAAGFFTSAAFVVPLLLLLIMLVVGLLMAFRARGRTVELLNKQLELENADKSFLLDKFNVHSVTNERAGSQLEVDGSDPTREMISPVFAREVRTSSSGVLHPAYSTSSLLQGSAYPAPKTISQARKYSQDLFLPEVAMHSGYPQKRISSSSSVIGGQHDYEMQAQRPLQRDSTGFMGSSDSVAVNRNVPARSQQLSESSDHVFPEGGELYNGAPHSRKYTSQDIRAAATNL